jgi:hypothetical protein
MIILDPSSISFLLSFAVYCFNETAFYPTVWVAATTRSRTVLSCYERGELKVISSASVTNTNNTFYEGPYGGTHQFLIFN